MAKKRVSSVDLSWMIFERLREEIGNKHPVSVAVVPDDELGWRAIITRRRISKITARKLRQIETEFRSVYLLARG